MEERIAELEGQVEEANRQLREVNRQAVAAAAVAGGEEDVAAVLAQADERVRLARQDTLQVGVGRLAHGCSGAACVWRAGGEGSAPHLAFPALICRKCPLM